MNINEEYLLTDISEYVYSDVTILFVGPNCDERSSFLRNQFTAKNKPIVELIYDYSNRKIIINPLYDTYLQPKKVSFSQLAGSIGNLTNINLSCVLFDITSLEHPTIICLTKALLQSLRPAKLFASYVKPIEYTFKNELGEYAFSEETSQASSVPGFVTSRKDEELLIPFLGFEGKRLTQIIGDTRYAGVYPIVGSPSDEPLWLFDTLRNCMSTIRAQSAEANIIKCKANSIFGAYNILLKIAKENIGTQLVLAPIGTRPHTTACAIFATKNRRTTNILYDYAREKPERTKGIRNTTIYNLSKYIKGGY